MIGLKYILNLYDVTQQDIADKLEIKRQNIDAWFQNKRNIPNKHLLILNKQFNLNIEYFQKELTEKDKLKLQKFKLIEDCNKLGLKLEEL